MNVTWRDSLGKSVYLNLVAVQTAKIIFLAYVDKVF